MSVILFEPQLRELLDSAHGPVGRNVTARAERVAELARQNVQANFRTRSGNLYNSIGTFPDESLSGLQYEVGTDGAPYGRLLELGTDPHQIEPINSPFLVSKPDNPDPLTGYRKQVSHPGNPPRPWLVPALRAVFLGG